MRLIIQKDYVCVSRWTAAYLAKQVTSFQPGPKKPFVLGLPTGSSPVGTYRELVRLCQAGLLSFKNIITFNMDEYVGLPRDHPQSYFTFMRRHLFDHVDLPPENIHVLDCNAPDLEQECRAYEDKMAEYDGVRLFLGGIGPDGHIAFNEPGSSLGSRTRIKTLNEDTIIANSRFFDGDSSKVPQTALTVGVATVMDAREVVLIVSGHSKARALRMVVEEGVNHMWTVSALQMHPKGMIVCDEDACAELRLETFNYFRRIERACLDPDTLFPTD